MASYKFSCIHCGAYKETGRRFCLSKIAKCSASVAVSVIAKCPILELWRNL